MGSGRHTSRDATRSRSPIRFRDRKKACSLRRPRPASVHRGPARWHSTGSSPIHPRSYRPTRPRLRFHRPTRPHHEGTTDPLLCPHPLNPTTASRSLSSVSSRRTRRPSAERTTLLTVSSAPTARSSRPCATPALRSATDRALCVPSARRRVDPLGWSSVG